MAETGSPQFVMARSVASYAAGAICFSTRVILAQAIFMTFLFNASPRRVYGPASSDSSYRLTLLIFVIQCFGVGIGTVAPAVRWFTAIRLRCSEKRVKNYKTGFKIENFWIERLVGWKDSPLAIGVRGQKSRKLVHNTKNLILNFCIGVQIVIVATSKLIMLISIYLISQFLSFEHLYKEVKQKLISKNTASSNHTDLESGLGTELELCRCVLYLEGDEELPLQIMKNNKDTTDHFIQKGEKQQPKYLKELLDKSTMYFHGVAKFDSDQVPSLEFEEPPNGWSPLMVTLTCIAIALLNMENHKVKWLLRSVSEGLLYVNLVEKLLNAKSDMVNIMNAADILWLRLDLFRKWPDEYLQKIALEVKTTKETLKRLANIAKITVTKFKANMNGNQKENPPSWDIKTIAANSMYRISQTVLLN
ncbi:uncharacterized protein LOC132305400 [Cornus florida]|uniref:uncharacterized protein LOC132305400 n=1 Tax=Cornus florida TaxID=4283 RepID=UPI0028A1A085|nr:uncharacterized protein LOC132305400 [Cornus florida]